MTAFLERMTWETSQKIVSKFVGYYKNQDIVKIC